MSKYLESEPVEDNDELAIAAHVCLGEPLPPHINAFEDRCLCARPGELWERYEAELLAIGPKPEYWPGMGPYPHDSL